MGNEEIFQKMGNTLLELEEEEAYALAHQAIEQKLDILKVIEKGYGKGMEDLGKLYEEQEVFLPELMVAADILSKVIEILKPHMGMEEQKSAGTIILATVEGDIHAIGKEIVGTILGINGYKIIDLGTDVHADTIIEAALEQKADIIGLSSMLTTTMGNQKELIEELEKRGLRDKFKVILGGAVVSPEWVKECTADGFAGSAFDAVRLVQNLF